MKNNVQLITYVDRLGGGGVARLRALLDGPLQGLFGGAHLLPFFLPIDGADAGFDPTDHTRVDPRLGDWADVRALSAHYEILADVIVNHISDDSPQFQDLSRRGAASHYDGMFLTRDAIFPDGASEADLKAIYRPRPGLPFSKRTLANGEQRVFWTTFTPNQLDIDVRHPQGSAYLTDILQTFSENGVRMVRLDAVGYAIKKAGTSCFLLPETFDFIDEFAGRAHERGMEVLVEIHSYYRRQIEIAARVDWVYDFALPPLLLHALEFKTSRSLKQWIRIRPNNALTVLDTHDGIGIIDIGADPSDRVGHPGLVPEAELVALVESIHRNSGGASRKATGAAASNLDLYQVNCTYYDALGRNDRAYLLARAVQFFLPGIPQVYYVGLLAGANDTELLERTRIGRDINRHRYTTDEITAAMQRPVVRMLFDLMRLRNQNRAFDGVFEQRCSDDATLNLKWSKDEHWAELNVNFESCDWRVTCSDARPLSAGG
jgi:sucrose phosphorylase